MTKWFVGKRRWYLVIAVAVIVLAVVVLARAVDQELVGEHTYPQDTVYENSNVTVRGIVTSIEENHKSYGFGIDCYHISRFYISLNITEVVWVGENLADSSRFSAGGSRRIGVGYDYLDDPEFSVGQVVECQGFYLGVLDSPLSNMITVAPSVSGSYIEID